MTRSLQEDTLPFPRTTLLLPARGTPTKGQGLKLHLLSGGNDCCVLFALFLTAALLPVLLWPSHPNSDKPPSTGKSPISTALPTAESPLWVAPAVLSASLLRPPFCGVTSFTLLEEALGVLSSIELGVREEAHEVRVCHRLEPLLVLPAGRHLCCCAVPRVSNARRLPGAGRTRLADRVVGSLTKTWGPVFF